MLAWHERQPAGHASEVHTDRQQRRNARSAAPTLARGCSGGRFPLRCAWGGIGRPLGKRIILSRGHLADLRLAVLIECGFEGGHDPASARGRHPYIYVAQPIGELVAAACDDEIGPRIRSILAVYYPAYYRCQREHHPANSNFLRSGKAIRLCTGSLLYLVVANARYHMRPRDSR